MTTFNKASGHASCTDDKLFQTRTEYISKSIREPVIVKGVFLDLSIPTYTGGKTSDE